MAIEYKFSNIYIDECARDDEITRNLLRSLPDPVPQCIQPDQSFQDYLASLSFSEGKRTLWITHFRGRFLKPCPGTAESYRCCNYLVINETTNCPIDCTYCILQGYINNPAITIYTNYRKIAEEIKALSRRNPNRILRIGTGELTDSLALDPATGLSEKLIKEVQQLPNVLLELKSKTDHIEHLLDINPERIVLSWSVNPAALVKSDELKAVPVAKRLKATRRAAEKGFMIGLHFDPIIYLPEWQSQYLELIGQIGEYVDPQKIAWISLGSLRYPPHLKETSRSRFPKSRIFSGEQIAGVDGKMRYLQPLRLRMYRSIYRALREKLGDVFVYFCMESEEIWQEVLGHSPRDNQEVDWLFARSLYHKFPELNLPRPEREIYQSPISFPDEEFAG
ncbi:MAG: hypothetical protein P8184_09555 [Calditrichia bacterium]